MQHNRTAAAIIVREPGGWPGAPASTSVGLLAAFGRKARKSRQTSPGASKFIIVHSPPVAPVVVRIPELRWPIIEGAESFAGPPGFLNDNGAEIRLVRPLFCSRQVEGLSCLLKAQPAQTANFVIVNNLAPRGQRSKNSAKEPHPLLVDITH